MVDFNRVKNWPDGPWSLHLFFGFVCIDILLVLNRAGWEIRTVNGCRDTGVGVERLTVLYNSTIQS